MKNREVAKLKIDVLFIIFEVELLLENSAVFQSQVIDQMIALKRIGMNVSIITPYKSKEKFEEIAGNYFDKEGIKYFLVNKRSFLVTFWSMIKILKKASSSYLINKCYVRGLWSPIIIFLSNPFSPLKYVYDVRGDLKDELVAVNTSWVKKMIYLSIEKMGIKYSSSVTAVTSLLLKNTNNRENYGFVIPCCIEFDKFRSDRLNYLKVRNDFKFEFNDIVFVYSGGLSHYQQVSQMLKIWMYFLAIPKIKFLLLTNDDPHSHPLTIKEGKIFGERLIHRKLKREDVPLVLASCDIAFMLREDRPLNRSASPVKFPEYLSAGLAVVASPGIGDISTLIVDENIGILVDPYNIVKSAIEIQNLLEDFELKGKAFFSSKAHKIAQEKYDWSSYIKEFKIIYN